MSFKILFFMGTEIIRMGITYTVGLIIQIYSLTVQQCVGDLPGLLSVL